MSILVHQHVHLHTHLTNHARSPNLCSLQHHCPHERIHICTGHAQSEWWERQICCGENEMVMATYHTYYIPSTLHLPIGGLAAVEKSDAESLAAAFSFRPFASSASNAAKFWSKGREISPVRRPCVKSSDSNFVGVSLGTTQPPPRGAACTALATDNHGSHGRVAHKRFHPLWGMVCTCTMLSLKYGSAVFDRYLLRTVD